MGRILLVCCGIGLCVGLPRNAHAHIALMSPPARYQRDFQKDGPCGRVGNPAGAGARTEFAPGDTIEIVWEEFVEHPGHLRVSLDPNGGDSFQEPAGYDERCGNALVLWDGIPDQASDPYDRIRVTLPNVECERCTLQILQVMTENPVYSESSLYYQCADLALRVDHPDPDFSATDVPGGVDCTQAGGTSTGTGTDSGGQASSTSDSTSGTGSSTGTTTSTTSGSDTSGSSEPSGAAGSSDSSGSPPPPETEETAATPVSTNDDPASGNADQGGCTATDSSPRSGAFGLGALVTLLMRRRARRG